MNILPNKDELNANRKYFQKSIDFYNISKLYEKKIFKKAFIQNCENEEKVENLVKAYLESNNGKLIHKLRNEITYCVINNLDNEYEFYNIDGQHRIQMAIKLHNNYGINDIFNVKFVYCYTTDEIRYFFKELNHDSIKNENLIIALENSFLCDVKNILAKEYSKYFAQKKSSKSQIFTVEEFIENIRNSDFEKFVDRKKYTHANDFIKDLIVENIIFNKSVNGMGYTELKNHHKPPTCKIFYSDELDILNQIDTLTIAFKRNNFIVSIIDGETKRGYFFRKKSRQPEHIIYNERKKISEKLKLKVWEKEYEDDSDEEQECPVWGCKNKITIKTCEMGHKLSRYNNGKEDLSNLRPICSQCNLKMSDKNWNEYEKELKDNKKKSKN
jgi:5-methylcytosine-specific restriction endonuclease McrA